MLFVSACPPIALVGVSVLLISALIYNATKQYKKIYNKKLNEKIKSLPICYGNSLEVGSSTIVQPLSAAASHAGAASPS